MTIENIENIIDAKLINNPKIKKINSATIFPSKVDLGDLFFATNEKDIEKAVENGAYAVVFEGKATIKDNEIAYLKVNSLRDALNKFLRYIISQKEVLIYYFNEIEASLLKQMTTRKNKIFTLLPDNLQKSFELILNSNYEIFITTDKEFASKIDPNFKELGKEANGYIISDSLLKTTFKIDKYIYQDKDIPPFFINDLKRVVYFLDNLKFEYNINNISYNKLFKPYFVDRLLNISKGSDNVLIFTISKEVIEKSLEYLKYEGKWTKSIVLTPPKVKIDNIDRPFWYKNIQEVKDVLKKEHYNYAFCYKLNPNDILNKNELTKALF